jgi:hypothetical protein
MALPAMHSPAKLSALGSVRGVRRSEAPASERGTEEMSDGDHLAGDDMPTGPVPPEPPCKKPTHGMHTYDPGVTAMIEFFSRDYSIFLQYCTVVEALRRVDEARAKQ